MGLFQMLRTYRTLKKKLEENKLDFSGVDTPEKAAELVSQGELVQIDLVPPQWGGKASPENRVFVPRFAAEDKKQADNMAEDLRKEGKADGYSCKVSRRAGSQVPTILDIEVTLNGEPVLMSEINIW